MRSGRLVASVAIGLLLGAILCGAGHAALVPGNTAPNFTIPLHDTSTMVNLYDYEGQIIVLDFFAYWCPHCAEASYELEPYVQEYYAARGGNSAGIPVQLMSICVSDQSNPGTDQYILDYRLELVLDDRYWDAFESYADAKNHIPQFAIINGAQGANYDPWEIIYTKTGYGLGDYPTFRTKINQVTLMPPGDANRDGSVNAADAAILAAHWLQRSGAGWDDGDFNDDHRVDDLDASILAAHWAYTSPHAASVPEPATAALLAGGLLTLAARAWRKRAGRS